MRIGGLWIGVAGLLATSAAHAGPATSYRWADPSLIEVSAPQEHDSRVLFLDRCAGGCAIAPGFDDSRVDTSSLVAGAVTLGEFRHGDAAWSQVVSCVREMYAPFGVEVTDVDPGDAPHFEAKVAGEPADIGATGIGGLAPFACGVIDNAITYSFANIYGSVEDLCETVAQESAHAFGLEHELLCADPMTYLTGCGAKRFQDLDAPCGGYQERDCECGGASQNSYRTLLSEFAGGGEPTVQAGDSCTGEACAEVGDPAGCALAGRDPAGTWMVLAAVFFLRHRRRR